jgi:hypothetical protein
MNEENDYVVALMKERERVRDTDKKRPVPNHFRYEYEGSDTFEPGAEGSARQGTDHGGDVVSAIETDEDWGRGYD